MSEPNGIQTTTSGEPHTDPVKTFTQEEVDALVGKRLAKAMKGVPSEEEMNSFRAWKAGQSAESARVAAIEKERDASKTALLAAQEELKTLKQSMYVASKGVSGDEAEFIAYKAAKMVNETTTFEAAVDELTKDRGLSFDWTAPIGEGTKKPSVDDAMNALIRGAAKK